MVQILVAARVVKVLRLRSIVVDCCWISSTDFLGTVDDDIEQLADLPDAALVLACADGTIWVKAFVTATLIAHSGSITVEHVVDGGGDAEGTAGGAAFRDTALVGTVAGVQHVHVCRTAGHHVANGAKSTHNDGRCFLVLNSFLSGTTVAFVPALVRHFFPRPKHNQRRRAPAAGDARGGGGDGDVINGCRIEFMGGNAAPATGSLSAIDTRAWCVYE